MVCDGNQELKEFSFQAIFRKIKWKYLKYTKYHILGGTFCPNMDKMIVLCKILDIKIIELHVRAENHKKLMNHSWEKCGPLTRFLPRQRLLVQSQLWKHLKMPEILLKLTLRHQNDVNDRLNRFHTLFWYFHWHRTGKRRLGLWSTYLHYPITLTIHTKTLPENICCSNIVRVIYLIYTLNFPKN